MKDGCFVSFQCVNGHCPNIPTEFDEREYDNGFNCSDCFFNIGNCSDCIFEGSDFCPVFNKSGCRR